MMMTIRTDHEATESDTGMSRENYLTTIVCVYE